MKNLLLLLMISVFVNCATDSSKEDNIALVEKYVKAVEDLDYATMESMLADDYLGLGPSYGDSIYKQEAISMWKQNVERLYASIDYNRSRNLAVVIPDGENKGEWVANWAELSIVYKEDNKKVLIWANTNYLIENGKIKKSLTFYNEADVLEQLGYVFIDPNDL